MLYLIIAALAGLALWMARRWWILGRGLDALAEAVRQRRAFLDEDPRRVRLLQSWRILVREANELVAEARQLREQRTGQLTQLELTLRNLQEAVLVIDHDNYILLSNSALLRMFPECRAPVGQRLETVLRSAAFLEHLADVRAGRGGAPKEIEFFAAGGSIWLETTGALIPETDDENGPWTLFVLHDVTHQKRLENVRKEFVANVSHELKTPLSVLKGYAETLVEDHGEMAPADRERFLRTILRHAERLSAIVEDLLVLSRLEGARNILARDDHDLAAILSGAAEEFGPRLAATGHQLTVVLPAEALRVTVDRLKITQVISNLLDNAQKHTPANTLVEVGAQVLAAGEEVEVWVRDNGPGIPAADLPRVFERFYRVEKGRSREKGGTGLGLSIVKHIVQLHGGRVRAESDGRSGTCIFFTLPVAGSPPKHGMAAAGTETSSMPLSAPRTGRP